MKIIDTIKDIELGVATQGVTPPLFTTMFRPEDKCYPYIRELASYYYFQHSGDKKLSPMYERFISIITGGSPNAPHWQVGQVIRVKYLDKWNRLYDTIIGSSYDELATIEKNETINTNRSLSMQYGHSIIKTTNDTNTVEYDTTVQDEGKRNSKETTTSKDNTTDSYYAFNSTQASKVNESDASYDETVEALANDNTSQNISKKSGKDENKYIGNDTENKTGTDTDTETRNITRNISERNEAGADLLAKELEFRNKYILFDVIAEDIDEVTTSILY